MKMSEKDVELFFDLMWPLQYYVNQRLNLLADLDSIADYTKCSVEEKYKVRNALFADKTLIDNFISENPQGLSKDHLAIVSTWKQAVHGNFHIERFLKRYAILIQDDKVYGVLGLHQGLEELIHGSHLPLYVETVLLPFQECIVYDGVISSFNLHFGGGIKRRLKETYLKAKQNQRIIETLHPAKPVSPQKKPARPLKDWTAELDTLSEKAKKLRASSNDPAIHSPAFSLVKASIEFAQASVRESPDAAAVYKALNKVIRAVRKSSTILERQE
jgi:hypothetical protein